MLYAVFGRAAPSSSSLTPVVFRDELHVASCGDLAGIAVGRELHSVLSPAKPPRVRHRSWLCTAGFMFDAVPHRDGNVVLSEERPRGPGNCHARHTLLHEDDGAAPSFACHSSHVETQIDLFEVPV